MHDEEDDVVRPWVLPAAFAALTAGGTVFSVMAPTLVGRLALRSSLELTAERPYALLSHLLLGAGIAGTVWTSLYVVLSSRLIAAVADTWRQAVLMVVGTGIGATVFVLEGTLEVLWGPGLMAWSLAGAAAVFGCWRWRTQRRGWRIFIVYTLVSIASTFASGTAVGKAQFASSALGALMMFVWSQMGVKDEDSAA